MAHILRTFSLCTRFVHTQVLGDYRNSARRPNAQKSQIFDLVKPAGPPPFLARPGQMKKNLGKRGGVRTPPLFG